MLKKLETLPAWLSEAADRNTGTLWQVVKAYRANLRQGTVGVKTRSMVVATGKKPYGQKKTGNARRGSFVSPLHVGGGVAHGPKPRDYREGINDKMASLALQIALASRVKKGTIFVGNLEVASGKTKDAAALLKGIHTGVGKAIICLDKPSETTIRAFRNIRGVVLVSPEQVNALSVVESRTLIATEAALNKIAERFSKAAQ